MSVNPRQYVAALREGYRSGLERKVGAQIADTLGLRAVQYETHTIRYNQPATVRRYSPDFILPNGIVIETKGRMKTADRQKHVLIKSQHPDIDIRFVFSNSNGRISKTSRTTYAMWCQKHGFPFADKWVPQEWFDEPVRASRVRAIQQFEKE